MILVYSGCSLDRFIHDFGLVRVQFRQVLLYKYSIVSLSTTSVVQCILVIILTSSAVDIWPIELLVLLVFRLYLFHIVIFSCKFARQK